MLWSTPKLNDGCWLTIYHQVTWNTVLLLDGWISIVGSLRDREVACSASHRQGSNFESCVWRTVSSQSSHHPQEVLLAQFSLYVHKGGLKPDSFHFISFVGWVGVDNYTWTCVSHPRPTTSSDWNITLCSVLVKTNTYLQNSMIISRSIFLF